MKKRLLALAATALLLVGQATAVFAEGSKTAALTLGDASKAGYVLTEDIEQAPAFEELKTDAPEVAELINKVNAGEMSMEEFAQEISEDFPEIAKKLADKGFLTKFYDLIALDGTEKTADGKYQVVFSVPAMTANTQDIAVLHYSTVRSLWEIIEPSSVDLEAKTITVEFEDLSPVAIIAKEGTFSTTQLGNQTSGTSPKTGNETGSIAWMGAAVVLFGMAVVISAKTRNVK